MNEQQTFERIVAESVSELGPLTQSDDAIERTLSSVDQKRQRPRWLALIKEPPMRTNSHLAVGSPTARVMAIMAATILLAVALAGAGIAGQRLLAADDSIIVAQDGSGDHASIQAAVDAAADGDTILVRPGTYDESVLIAKDITIRGDGKRDAIVIANSEVIGSPAGVDVPDVPAAFRLEGSDAMIENVTLRGESSRVEIHGGSPTLSELHFDDIGRVYGVDPGGGSVPAGVAVREGSTASIVDSTFSGSTLFIHSASSPEVLRNRFSPGAIFMGGEGTEPLIEDNTISAEGSFHAVTAWGGAKPTIRGNTISSEQDGINVRDAGFPSRDRGPWPTIEDNTIVDSRTGISVAGGAGADIVANTLERNATGILVGISNATVVGNDVSGGTIGIAIGNVSPRIRDNTIEGNERGLSMGPGATPALEGNTVCGNASNLYLVGNAEMPDTSGNEICEDAPTE